MPSTRTSRAKRGSSAHWVMRMAAWWKTTSVRAMSAPSSTGSGCRPRPGSRPRLERRGQVFAPTPHEVVEHDDLRPRPGRRAGRRWSSRSCPPRPSRAPGRPTARPPSWPSPAPHHGPHGSGVCSENTTHRHRFLQLRTHLNADCALLPTPRRLTSSGAAPGKSRRACRRTQGGDATTLGTRRGGGPGASLPGSEGPLTWSARCEHRPGRWTDAAFERYGKRRDDVCA